MSHYCRRQQQPLPPTDSRFRMRAGEHYLIVSTTRIGVQVEYYSQMAQAEPDWRVWLDYDENPDLLGLRDARLGWDLVGLARLLWAYVGAAQTVELTARQDGKVSTPSHLMAGVRVWRESHQTEALILELLGRVNRPLSRAEIARELGLTKNPRLIELIESMVAGGELSRTEEPLANGKTKYLYSDNRFTP